MIKKYSYELDVIHIFSCNKCKEFGLLEFECLIEEDFVEDEVSEYKKGIKKSYLCPNCRNVIRNKMR